MEKSSSEKFRKWVQSFCYSPECRCRRWAALVLTVLAVVWLCSGSVLGQHYNLSEMGRAFEAYSPREASAMEEVACEAVNVFEQRVDDAMKKGDEAAARAELPSYATVLSSFRTALSIGYRGENLQCRTQRLGEIAHEEGLHLAAKWVRSKDHASNATWGQYETIMQELAIQLNDARETQRFWRLAPWIWQWCNSGDYRVMDKNPDAASSLAKGISLGVNYGNPVVQTTHLRLHGNLKMERVQHSQHLMFLQLAANADVVNGLDQIVEFGGGTGDMAATLRDNGFRGMYIVYDMEPMTMLQLYWLRYSGHAAFLSKNMQKTPGLRNNTIVVQAAEDTAGFRKMLFTDDNHYMRSAFLSFWAFNEADVDARDKIAPDIQNFGRILLAVQFNKEGRYGWINQGGKIGVDVVDWMKKWVEGTLSKTHNTCVWHYKIWEKTFPGGGYYFVATRKELPPPRCLESLNCNPSTKHPTIPSTC